MQRAAYRDIPAEHAFAKAEYDARIAKVRTAMVDARLDVLLLHSLPDICWLTGFQTPLSDWYSCLILPQAGEPVLQVCDHELAAMHTYVDTILPVQWEDMDTATSELAAHLIHAGAGRRRIGLQRQRPGLDPYTEAHLRAALPDAQFVEASNLVPRIRAVKSVAEIACLREAARLSTLGMEAAIAQVAIGATENGITAAAMHAIVAAGGEYFGIDPIVRAGPRSGVTHATAKRAVVQAGDPVLMEIGGVHQRYCAPLLRTAVVGAPCARLERLADASLHAMALLYENLRPGRSMGDVASAAMAALADLPPGVHMRGYFGYGVGIAFPPSWVERSYEIAVGRDDVLLPGMTFHTHRVLRIPGVIGVGFSESVVITDAGFDFLTLHPRRLEVL